MNIQAKNDDIEKKYLLNTFLFFLPNEEQNENMFNFHSARCGMNFETGAGANRKVADQKVRKMEELDPEPASQNGLSLQQTETEIPEGSLRYPVLEFHIDKYLEHIKDIDMSDDEAQEYLRTYWQILVAFVDLNFDLHPICQAMEVSDETPNPLSPELATLIIEDGQPDEDNKEERGK